MDDTDPMREAFAELEEFALPLRIINNRPLDDPIQAFRLTHAAGTPSHLGAEVPVAVTQVIGPKKIVDHPNFKPKSLTAEVRQLGLKWKPKARDRIYGTSFHDHPEDVDKEGENEDNNEGAGDPGQAEEEPSGGSTLPMYQHHNHEPSAPFNTAWKELLRKDKTADLISIPMKNVDQRDLNWDIPENEMTPAQTAALEAYESRPDWTELHALQAVKRLRDENRAEQKARKEMQQTAEEDIEKDKNCTHMDYEKSPLSDIYQIFQKLAKKGLQLKDEDGNEPVGGGPLQASCKAIGYSAVRIFTMCSGTEAPILAMDLVKESLQQEGVNFNFKHVASAEIEPFKQGYIELNFQPDLLFRDVTEFNHRTATTAYGAKVAVPSKVHLVVAGSACVDYSTLNHYNKEWGAAGESYATMMGVINYCLYNQPAMVILENIKGAPWKHILHKWHTDVGYDVIAASVDSKNFMIPQTRQRGYMFAINRKLARDLGFDSSAALQRWLTYFEQLQQRCSSSYTEFIYSNDSPQNERVRFLVESTAAPGSKEISWSLCAHRYLSLRAKNKYGTLRPFTYWQENGSTRLPDYVWQVWLKVQRARVLDTLDIAHLRYVVDRDYDMSAKSRTVDLSQNIDRDLDSKAWGIVGCLTSTGQLFDTYRGGVVSGIEALILQGIPVDDLILSKLAMKHMIDLAGNAMTSTVVGAAMVAAIAAATNDDVSMLTPYLASPKTAAVEVSAGKHASSPLTTSDCEKLLNSHGLQEGVQRLTPEQEDPLDVILQKAHAARQMCSCEGVTKEKNVNFQICKDCGHTSCVECGVNPSHNYVALKSSSRMEPLKFIEIIKTALPHSLMLSDSNGFAQLREAFKARQAFKELAAFELQKDLTEQTDDTFVGHGTFAGNIRKLSASSLKSEDLEQLNAEYRELVLGAFEEPLHYQTVKRGVAWKVEFSSAKANLTLFFEPTNINTSAAPDELAIDCYWLLSVVCPTDVPQGGLLREKLQHPVVRMYPKGSLLQGTWEFWDHDSNNETTATVTRAGKFNESMEAKSGIVDSNFSSLRVSQELHIDFDEALYPLPKSCKFIHCQDCGTASGLLYRSEKRLALTGTRKKRFIYLFLDPGHLQDAIYDSMVIAVGHERIPRTETRMTLAKFATGWRPVSDSRPAKQGLFRSRVKCEQTGSWLSLPSAVLTPCKNESQVRIWSPDLFGNEGFTVACGEGRMAFGVFLPDVPELSSSFGNDTDCITLDLADKRGKLKSLGFILGRLEIPGALAGNHFFTDVTSLLDFCEICCPDQPQLEWKWVRGRADKKLQLRPMDDPDRSRDYERALKSRPPVAEAVLHRTANGAFVILNINVAALLHRTIASLMRYAPDGNRKVCPKISWSVESYNALYTAPIYKIPSLRSNNGDPAHEPPSVIVRTLWQSQLKTLHWMTEVEKHGVIFKERTVQENPIKTLDWNITAKASHEVKVRGGILADGVGTGKTTVVLSLVAEGASNKAKQPENGSLIRKKSRATLILVPVNLLQQWKGQIQKCFRADFIDDRNIIIIDSFASLMAFDIDRIADVTIVLVALSMFEDVKYWQHLRDLCYAPNIPTKSGRAYIQWLQATLKKVGKLCRSSNQFGNLEMLHDCRQKLRKALRTDHEFAKLSGFRKKDMANLDPDKLDVPVSANGDDVDVNLFPHANKFDNTARFDVDHYSTKGPQNNKGSLLALFHLFDFKRVVVDEFQYLSPKSYAAISMLKRKHTWLISGTPPIDTIDDVDAMARLLGTRITMRANEFVGQGFALETARAMLKERSYVEEFQAFNDIDSVAVTDLQNRQAESFLRKFVRCNTIATMDVKIQDHWMPFRPQAGEMALFLQYYIGLNNDSVKFAEKDFEFKLIEEIKKTIKPNPGLFGNASPDTSDVILRNFQQSRSAYMATVCCFAANILGPAGNNQELTLQTLHENLEREFEEYMDLLLCRIQEAVTYFREGEDLATLQFENSDLPDWIDETMIWGRLGDLDLTLFVDQMLGYAMKNPDAPEEMLSALTRMGQRRGIVNRDNKDLKVRNKEMQERVANLREIAKKSLKTMRSLRLIACLLRIVLGEALVCVGCSRRSMSYKDFKFLATCGHVFCHRCQAEVKEDWDGNCLATGCDSVLEPQNVFNAAKFGRNCLSAPAVGSSRALAILDQVKKILSHDPASPASDHDDYVVIFAQHIAQAKELELAFAKEGIKLSNACVDPGMGKSAAKAKKAADLARATIERFKTAAMEGNERVSSGFRGDLVSSPRKLRKLEEGGRSHVLMLMIDSEDAAGWNLQVANHVFFVSAREGPNSFRDDGVSKQAVGRCARYGQKKTVHVYHFGMAYTCEMHVMEERAGGMALKKFGEDWRWVDRGAVGEEESLSGPAL